MALFIVALILFVILDVLIRYFIKQQKEKKLKRERAAVLEESINLDFSKEAKTLKRAEIDNPKAKILCVDDEAVILDSFRKILVLEGYSIDTVESGGEALSLIKSNHYDFVFTDLKMPEMSGVDVTKAVKHLRPDIDVMIITGFASVDTAVECMKYGAMDYVEKPFTEDELIEFTNKALIKRKDNIQKQLKPRVHISHFDEDTSIGDNEFSIPGGVFISEGHAWASVDQDGTVKIGIDDFAKKIIGKIDDIDFPNLGMKVEKGNPLFSIKQNRKSITFNAPISGTVTAVNDKLTEDLDVLEYSSYEKNWFCAIDADKLDEELPKLKIGKSAVNFYQRDIDDCRETFAKLLEDTGKENMYVGAMEKLEEKDWNTVAATFFDR
ncbi:MAG: response regulator [Ignavibacteriae bacterium]|nr:response regulator [Ignavibacteriota bacterium]NOG97976.1 response regulator [Ignavibacteriota bacterium]